LSRKDITIENMLTLLKPKKPMSDWKQNEKAD